MKNKKISTAIAEKVMTGVLTILMAISVTACGSTKEQANSAATEVTEAVVTILRQRARRQRRQRQKMRT